MHTDPPTWDLPEVLLSDSPVPAGRRPRLLATGFGGSIRSSFSGSSVYLAEAGIERGVLDGAFTLYSDAVPDRVLSARGAMWKLRRLMSRQQRGGFKFAPEFSDHLWDKFLPSLAGTDVVNNFQLFSDDFWSKRDEFDVRGFFYLDGTLHDYLRGYREFDVASIDPASVDRAIAAERNGYQRCDGIAVMSEFAARSLVDVYGIPRSKIAVVLPGANVSDSMAEAVIAARREHTPGPDVVLGFIGVYPERKGLPLLAAAVEALRSEGVGVRLRVVGRCPADIANMEGVDYLGFIDKQKEPERFVSALAGMDLGCLLSQVELSGIAMLEFLRCGIPVAAKDVGGLPDNLVGGGGFLIPAGATLDEVVAALRSPVTRPSELQALTTAAHARIQNTGWGATADALTSWMERTPN